MDRKIILGVGVAAAVGSAAAAAFAAYLVLKDDHDGPAKGSDGIPHTSSRPVSIEVRIPTRHIAHVIGRGGDTIKEIQRKTNTRIHFKDELATDSVRVCIINGQPDEAQLAEILIHQTIANQPRVETLVLMVPCNAMGCIIGRNGENIRHMQTYSKCKIEVERTQGNGPRKVTLTGTGEQIAVAKDLIDEKVLLVAEREQARADQRLFMRNKNEPESGQGDCKNTSKLSVVDKVDRVMGSKRVSESEEFNISPKPSLLYLTSEPDAKSELQAAIKPNYKHEELRPTGTDQVIEIYVSSILNPSQFYVQKVGPESVALDKLVQDMTAYYEVTANQKMNEISIVKPGDLVASQIPSDNSWYRARVIEVIIPDDEYDETQIEVDIDFVDFGDCERKPITSVFRLLDNFLNLNFQAIECCLADVISKWKDTSYSNGGEEQWSEEAINDFERLTHASQWKVILAKVKGYKTRASNSANHAGYDKESEVIENTSDITRTSPICNVPCIELVDTNSNQVYYTFVKYLSPTP